MRNLIITRLTREGRDTLWLLIALAWCLAPHAGRLPLWCTVGTTIALVWRARLAWTDGALPSRSLLFGCLAACLALTWSTHHTLFGREAGITLIAVLAALKTLELRARRDAFVVTCLGFFLAFTQFLFSQSILTAVLMLIGSWGLMGSLVLAQRPLGRPTISSAMKASGQSMAWGLPLMLALYVFFPRLGPLWSLPADAGFKTGLSDELRLGHVSELVQDDSIAMRLQFDSAPPPDQLYFRGPVLTRFDGRVWTARSSTAHTGVAGKQAPTILQGKLRVSYQLTLEPTRLRSLPLLDGTSYASTLRSGAMLDLVRFGLDWEASGPLMERTQIGALAWLDSREDLPDDPHSREEFLQLPDGFDPRTRAWARSLRASPQLAGSDARTLSAAVMAHIRRGGFSYTLAPDDRAPGADGRPELHQIDRFWMDRRAGFCEHFSTAYVVVMRSMGVPARVVTGFQGAERNIFDGLYVVRNSDAHAWAEFWQAGEGWVRADPTSAVAPERIARGAGQRFEQAEVSSVLNETQGRWLKTLRSYIDAGNHRWNIWVLQYSGDRQIHMLKSWGVNIDDWSDLLRICAAILTTGSLAGLVVLKLTQPTRKRSRWERNMWKLHHSLTKLGIQPPDQCPAPAPALAWAQRLINGHARTCSPDWRDEIVQRLQAIDMLRYAPAAGDKTDTEHRANSLVREIEQRVSAHCRSSRSNS